MRILFVCTGNTCRSPMAEAAWHSLPVELSSQAEVSSAGLMARPGVKAAAHSVEIARGWNVDLESHRARRVDEAILQENDLIVTMTTDGANVTRECFPDYAARVRVLGEFARFASDAGAHAAEMSRMAELMGVDTTQLESADIDDPFGGTLHEYELAAVQIRRAVEGLAISIRDGEVTAQ